MLIGLYKATGPGHVPDLLVEATMEMPEPSPGEHDFKAPFREEAKRLYDALVRTLPQGTLDHLFGFLAMRAASSFIIRDDPDDPKDYPKETTSEQ